MKKSLFLVVLILCRISLLEPVAVRAENNHEAWDEAIRLISKCVYEKHIPSCFKVWYAKRTIIKGKNIYSGDKIVTKEKHVGFFQVKASIEVIPYSGATVSLIFRGDTDFKEYEVWSGYDTATIDMSSRSPYKNPVHITAYVPIGNSISFAQVNGVVTIVNEPLLRNVVKKATSKTVIKSVQR